MGLNEQNSRFPAIVIAKNRRNVLLATQTSTVQIGASLELDQV